MKHSISHSQINNTLIKVSSGTNQMQLPWPIEMRPLYTIRSARRNARTHSKKQIRQIADCMARFGVTHPLLVGKDGRLVAGDARRKAAELLGLDSVPVVCLQHLSEDELRAYALADNKLAEKAGWDRELLAAELQELQIALPTIDLSLDITGFEPAEVDSILIDLAEDRANPADEIPTLQTATVARDGDVFALGSHRITVGDARREGTYARLMQSESAAMAFLDPPYNVKIQGHVGGRGRIKHREFKCASGEMSTKEYCRFLEQALGQCTRHVIDGGITYVCMDWRHTSELLTTGAKVYDELKNICVWTKTTPGQGSFYRSQHEFVFVYKQGEAPHLNTFELGQHGRTRSNVWTYPGANAFRAGRIDELKMHPTVKPVALIVDAMKDCSRRGSVILDAFAGSGTTIIAAEQIGRRAFCIEIDPLYVDVSIRRWQHFTGKDAILESTGQSFIEIRPGNRHA